MFSISIFFQLCYLLFQGTFTANMSQPRPLTSLPPGRRCVRRWWDCFSERRACCQLGSRKRNTHTIKVSWKLPLERNSLCQIGILVFHVFSKIVCVERVMFDVVCWAKWMFCVLLYLLLVFKWTRTCIKIRARRYCCPLLCNKERERDRDRRKKGEKQNTQTNIVFLNTLLAFETSLHSIFNAFVFWSHWPDTHQTQVPRCRNEDPGGRRSLERLYLDQMTLMW